MCMNMAYAFPTWHFQLEKCPTIGSMVKGAQCQTNHKGQRSKFETKSFCMLAGTVCSFKVASCVEQTWKELYEAPDTSKHCSLLPSVFRMDRRHGGYLFFDERGRSYRLRDEEILLRQDAAWKISRARRGRRAYIVSQFLVSTRSIQSTVVPNGVFNLAGPCGLGTFLLFCDCVQTIFARLKLRL